MIEDSLIEKLTAASDGAGNLGEIVVIPLETAISIFRQHLAECPKYIWGYQVGFKCGAHNQGRVQSLCASEEHAQKTPEIVHEQQGEMRLLSFTEWADLCLQIREACEDQTLGEGTIDVDWRLKTLLQPYLRSPEPVSIKEVARKVGLTYDFSEETTAETATKFILDAAGVRYVE